MRPYSSILQHFPSIYNSLLTNSMRKEYKESDQVMQGIREFDQLLRATGLEIFPPPPPPTNWTTIEQTWLWTHSSWRKEVPSHEGIVKCWNMSRDGNGHLLCHVPYRVLWILKKGKNTCTFQFLYSHSRWIQYSYMLFCEGILAQYMDGFWCFADRAS